MAALNLAGTFALIWIVLWAGLTLLFGLCYPLLRKLLFRRHPAHAGNLLMVYWTLPVLLAFTATLLLYTPVTDGLLVSAHCHGNCGDHVPSLNSDVPAWAGLALVILLTGRLLGSFLHNLAKGMRMQKRFDLMARRGPGYRLLDAREPVVFTLGWWRPRVYISRALLDTCSENQLAVILDHEQAHRQRRDNLRLLIAQVCCLTLPQRWRKPIMDDLYLLSEQACDFAAAARHDALRVAETIIHVGRVLRQNARPAESAAFSGSDLESRVVALLNLRQLKIIKPWQNVLTAALILALVLLSLNPLHHGAERLFHVLEHAIIHTTG